jgi:type IV secretory pathway VirJ component
MKLKLTFLAVAAAAFAASAAYAAKPATHPAHPTHPTTPASTNATSTNAAHPTVMYVLHGTIAAYTAATSTANGSVSLTVTGSNHHAAALKSLAQPLVFVIGSGSSSKVVGTVTVGDKATLKWRAAKVPTTSAPTGAIFQLIDQGKA